MNCLMCGGEMTTQRENVPYRALPGVTLVNINVSRCPECGEYEIEIPRIEELNRVLAEAVVMKTSKITPDEVRFLRKYMGLSGVDFAKLMGVTKETVSKWEHGKMPMGKPTDRLLRLLVVTSKPIERYPIERLKEIEETTSPAEYRLTDDSGTWLHAA